MANELRLTYQGAHSVYVVLQAPLTGQAANLADEAFEAWSNANLDDYDLALASIGGDLYAADMPDWITAGTRLRASYYAMAGATPATTDVLVKSEELLWTGTQATPAAGTLAEKVALFHPSYSAALLTVLIESIEARVSVICNLGGYTEGEDAELDAFVVRKVREAIADEEAGGLKARTIGVYSETMAAGGEAFWTQADLAFLGRKTSLIAGYE